ncbi:MAG TPA: hypothetical protein VH642_01970 [Streptosporangiaceae bacterium]
MTAREGQDRYDPAWGTPVRGDLDDVLRQALHAVADAIEPADDGLTRIMRRLTTPSLVRQVALLVTDCVDLARLITIWLEPAFTGAMRLRRRRHAGYRRGFSHQATGAPVRPAVPWLRPALAVASAVTIVVIAVVVLGQVRQIVIQPSVNTGTGTSTPAHGGTHSAGAGHGQSPTANFAQTAPAGPGTTPAHAGRTTPNPSPTITPSGSPAASPSQSPGPTPTPSKTNNGHHNPHPGKTKSPPPGQT